MFNEGRSVFIAGPATDARGRPAPGAGDFGADDQCTNGGGRKSGGWNTRGNGTGNSRGMRVKSRANRGVCRGDLLSIQSNAENYERRMPVGHLFAVHCR